MPTIVYCPGFAALQLCVSRSTRSPRAPHSGSQRWYDRYGISCLAHHTANRSVNPGSTQPIHVHIRIAHIETSPAVSSTAPPTREYLASSGYSHAAPRSFKNCPFSLVHQRGNLLRRQHRPPPQLSHSAFKLSCAARSSEGLLSCQQSRRPFYRKGSTHQDTFRSILLRNASNLPVRRRIAARSSACAQPNSRLCHCLKAFLTNDPRTNDKRRRPTMNK
jgi:hypothetical protein